MTQQRKPDNVSGHTRYRCVLAADGPDFLASLSLTKRGGKPDMTTETTNTTESARALKARHAQWGTATLSGRGTESRHRRWAQSWRGVRDRARGRVARRGRRTGKTPDPAAEAGASVGART